MDRSHAPVLLEQAIDALAIKSSGIYVDATFGRGGHAAQILARLGPRGKLLAIDRDPEAVAMGRSWRDERFEIVHARFDELARLLSERALSAVDGVLLDLGVSSPQLDDPARGFSFKADGPLDMRMDPTEGVSARQWLGWAAVEEIEEVLKTYGQERFAVQIAKAIVARRGDAGGAAIETTRQLAGLVARTLGKYQRGPALGKDPATRTFQAIRIHVNQELAQLARVLEQAVTALAPAGRLVVISFHSLEDRIVKQFIAERRAGARAAPAGASKRLRSGSMSMADDAGRSSMANAGPWLRAVRRVLPDRAEQAANPRARSAVLRVAERVGGDDVQTANPVGAQQ